MKKISIVSPCYNEFENIDECHLSIQKLFKQKQQIGLLSTRLNCIIFVCKLNLVILFLNVLRVKILSINNDW